MRRILAALIAISFALPVGAEPPQQALRPIEDVEPPQDPVPAPPQGTTVLVTPLVSMNGVGASQPLKVLRLPIQAGKVSKMVTTNIIANSKGWIAKGNKYYSLCTPDGSKVACAPIVATSTMRDIEVGATYADDNGEPKVTFTIAPGTTQEPKRLIAAMNYFLVRIDKQATHFERKAANKAASPAPAKVGNLGGNIAPAVVLEGGEGGCSHDEFGGYDCVGGDGGAGGDGYESDSDDWGEDNFADEESWDDASTSTLPTFPSGNDNGDADPCTDASGNNRCQQVIITGQRPEPPQEMALDSCLFTPFAVFCRRDPPVVGGVEPVEQLPGGAQPWLPQGACNLWGALCSAGQVPAEDPPPLTERDRRAKALKVCIAEAIAELNYCHELRQKIGEAEFQTCRRNAIDSSRGCELLYGGS